MATYEEQIENLLIQDIGAVKECERSAFLWSHFGDGWDLDCYAVPPHRLRSATEVHA